MLNFFRKRTKIIVWVVVIAFVSWGGYAVSLQFSEGQRAAGKIFGKEISFRDFLQAQRTVQIFTPTPEPGKELPSAEEIDSLTWEFLMLSQEARRRKIEVTDEEVLQGIRDLLSKDSIVPLTAEQYQGWVRNTLREEPHQFESQFRERLRIQKLIEGVKKEFKENPEEELKKWTLEFYARAQPQSYESRRA